MKKQLTSDIENVNRVFQKRELVSQTFDLCDSIYSTFEQLYKDFPGANCSNLYEAYKDKINDLKETLREKQLFDKEIDSRLHMVLIDSKNLDSSLYARDMNELTKLMERFID